jgi:glucan phosphoethanolaminetransferase (alkaline phosphatase superfamily)
MELLLKLPIPITILYFIGNSSTQTVCFFIYFAFFLLLIVIVPVRRRVYSFIMIMNAAFLVLNALGAILVAKGLTSSTYFDGVWLTIILMLFLFTLFQAISNYHFFISCLSYLKYQIKNGFSSKEPQNNESQSNLTSQEEQSVVF